MTEITNVDRYKEQYAHFRSMNDILYKIPPIFTAILGGLWYFASSNLDKYKWVACGVFIFCTIASICFVNIMQRFRMAFNAYIDNLNKMDGDLKVSIKPSKLPSTIATIQYLLWAAAAISVAGAIYAYKQ
ncbi:hypothetical protein QWJ07_26565 [Frankia sp. RB7]|nr:hypothetical protein [Frankia sp. RB7]